MDVEEVTQASHEQEAADLPKSQHKRNLFHTQIYTPSFAHACDDMSHMTTGFTHYERDNVYI